MALVGCGGDPAVRAASRGDLPALTSELDARAAKGKLDESELRDVARALLDHDLERFDGADGVRRVQALTGCARAIKTKLAGAAERNDDVGAAAAYALVSAGLVDVDAYTGAHRDDALASWRAVATRGLVDRSESSLRMERATADDKDVRRAAIEAAGDAGCASDFPVLLESARHDPETIIRVDAVRAVARIADKLEGDTLRAELVDRFGDLWKGGDEALRGSIARAYATPALLDFGGRRELELVVGNEDGHVGAEAASALMLAGGSDGELKLVKLAQNGDAASRAHAIRLLDPMRASHLDALYQATQPAKKAPDDTVSREVAAESIARVPASMVKSLPKIEGVEDVGAAALQTLKTLSASRDRVGTDAAIALAELGDQSMRARLIDELKTASPMRTRVVSALVHLGFAADVRSLLTSSDVDVRDGAACAVLR